MKRTTSALIGFGWLLVAGPAEAQQSPPPAPEVPVAKVLSQTVPEFQDYVGQTASVHEVDIRSEVTGYLEEQAFDEGGDVKKGDLLFVVDPRKLQADVDAAKAQIEFDVAAAKFAQEEVDRFTPLAARNVTTKEQLESLQADLEQKKAQIEVSKANLNSAQVALEYATIEAPVSGRMSRSYVDTGNLVTSAETILAKLVQTDPIYVYFNPPETAISRVVAAQAKSPLGVRVTVRGDEDNALTGQLDYVDNIVDAATGTVEMRGKIANPSYFLRPGQFVSVRLFIADRPDTLLIPEGAVTQSQAGPVAYVVGSDNKIAARKLVLGQVYQGMQIVTKGLKADEMVVTEGLQKLRPGMTVKPKADAGS